MQNKAIKMVNKYVVIFTLAAIVLFLPQGTQAAAYTYTNDTYGFSIQCPEKPIAAIDLKNQPSPLSGVMLIFENEGFDIKHAWVITTEAFTDKQMPDLEALPESTLQRYLNAVMESDYTVGEIVQVDGKKALYTVKGEAQTTITYIRGESVHYAMLLVSKPESLVENTKIYKDGLKTFKSL